MRRGTLNARLSASRARILAKRAQQARAVLRGMVRVSWGVEFASREALQSVLTVASGWYFPLVHAVHTPSLVSEAPVLDSPVLHSCHCVQ